MYVSPDLVCKTLLYRCLGGRGTPTKLQANLNDSIEMSIYYLKTHLTEPDLTARTPDTSTPIPNPHNCCSKVWCSNES